MNPNHKAFSTPDVMSALLQQAHGEIPYGMTNDYMFRAVLQTSNQALRGLICSLLHLAESEVISVAITNPIVLGNSPENKEFRLDINVVLNNHTLINLEMQIANRLNWRDRSVMYLCRSFDQLNHGQNYAEAKPVIHIGFLDYTLFMEHPEFYASYKLINVKNYQKYSDNITLNVIDLSRIDLATDIDKRYHIHEWAMLFKAATWEEIKMLAAKDKYLNAASETMFRLSTEEQIRKQCRDREEYYQDMRNYERVLSERDSDILAYQKALASREATISDCQKALASQEATISDCQKALASQEVTISDYQKALASQEATISDCQKALASQEATISDCQKALASREATISDCQKALADKDSQIAQLLAEIETLKS